MGHSARGGRGARSVLQRWLFTVATGDARVERAGRSRLRGRRPASSLLQSLSGSWIRLPRWQSPPVDASVLTVGAPRIGVAVVLRFLLCVGGCFATLAVGAAPGSGNADQVRVSLGIPQPWLVPPGDPYSIEPVVVGPKNRGFIVVSGAGSGYQFQRMSWRGWGTTRAVGTGRVRYCGDSCERWYSTRLVATALTRCESGSSRRFYRSFRALGVDGTDHPTLRAARVCR
jgi:hypothetical protein